MTDKPPPPVTLADQAYMIDRLVKHCTMRDGQYAETLHHFSLEEVEQLAALRDRLERMIPYERQIRSLVTGR